MRRYLTTTLSAAAAAAVTWRLPADITTLDAALSAATSTLAAHGVPEPGISAEHLLCRSAGFGSDRMALRLHAGGSIQPEARETFEAMCTQRLDRVPVQYILGDWDFRELTLALRAPVLIPRPETEELVGHVIDACGRSGSVNTRGETPLHFLDVGCGSGAIGLALLHELPSATCVGIDVSEDAIALAADNAKLCDLERRYQTHHVAGGVVAFGRDNQDGPSVSKPAGATSAAALFDYIVSNPPYIPLADMAALEPEVANYEDERALCGGVDGLDVVRDLLLAAPLLLRPDGPRTIWLEVDTSHPPLLDEWLRSPAQTALRMKLVQWLRDVSGRPRFCEVRWIGEEGELSPVAGP